MANWWQETPIRLVQTNLREIDARRDPKEIVREVRAFGANAILFSVGGIVSFYPSQLEYQTIVPYLRGDGTLAHAPLHRNGADSAEPIADFVGAALEEAHSLGLRFVARLDLSKCHKHVYESHPEWFFRRLDGQPQVYNGLYSTCVNGGYYRQYSFEIVGEILDRYDVDGVFFNMFGYKSYDYSGNYHGLCQCDNCQRRYREMYGRALPQAEDFSDPAYLDYVRFTEVTTDELTQAIADSIHRKPNTALVNYQVRLADVVRSESNSAVDRPLPMWQFSGSDNVKRVRGTYPQKPSSNAAVYFVDIPYRFTSVSPHLTELRLAQDLAHGGDVDLYVLGTLQQQDRSALEPARQIFQFAAKHQDAYKGFSSLANVCLLYPAHTYPYGKSSQAAYRGMFRVLSEGHILFDSAHDFILGSDGAEQFLERYKLLILPGAACLSDRQLAAIDGFVSQGGRLLATGETALYDGQGRPREEYGLASLGVDRVETIRPDMRSAYFRVHDVQAMGQLDSELIFLDGPYLFTTLKQDATTSLTLVPPSTYGPPEKCFIDKVESERPGIVWHAHGEGQTAYFPWNVDALYYRHSSPGHKDVILSAVSNLQPERQLITDAGPQVEVALFSQGNDRFVVNLVNLSGHHGTAFFAPVPMHEIEIRVLLPRPVQAARSLKLDRALTTRRKEEYVCLTLDKLELFDTIQLW
jgi:hypothetical protein